MNNPIDISVGTALLISYHLKIALENGADDKDELEALINLLQNKVEKHDQKILEKQS